MAKVLFEAFVAGDFHCVRLQAGLSSSVDKGSQPGGKSPAACKVVKTNRMGKKRTRTLIVLARVEL
jgi:hypothetical protein